MHINDLADDCLLQIFNRLSVTERIRDECVCIRWRRLLPRAFIDTQQMDLADFMVRTFRTHYPTDSIQFTPTTVGLLRRCGPFLREISFGKRWLKVSQEIIDTISEQCHKLTTLNLSCVILHADIRPALRQLAPQLVAFSLDETHWIQERDALGIENYFPFMQNLKRLYLKRAPFSLDTLDQLPTDLEIINLSGARQLDLDILQMFLLNHTALRQLHLSSFQQIEQSTLEIIGSMPSLRVLELSCINRDDLDLSAIANLKDSLEELYLQSNNSLIDAALRRICLECSRLSILNLCNCRRLRDFGALAHCRNLTSLLASQTPQICDTDLTDIAVNGKLQSLTLSQCVNIGTPGLSNLALRCPLREINIVQCTGVDDSTLLALVDNHQPTPSISLQNCRITNDGVTALGQLDGSTLARLCELDISYNRSINNGSIMAVYHAIANSPAGQNLIAEAAKSTPFSSPTPKPTIHVHQTAVSKDLAPLVDDCLRLLF